MSWKSPRLRAALIAHDDTGRILLLEHVREHGKYWVLPGGGVEPGETIEQALAREIREELGVGCIISRLAAVGELIILERHVVDFFYCGIIDQQASFTINHEEGIGTAEWIEPARLADIKVLPPEIVPVLVGTNESDKVGIQYVGKYKLEE